MNLVLCGSLIPPNRVSKAEHAPELLLGLGLLDQTFRATQAAKEMHRPHYLEFFLLSRTMLTLALDTDSLRGTPLPRSAIDLRRICANGFTKP